MMICGRWAAAAAAEEATDVGAKEAALTLPLRRGDGSGVCCSVEPSTNSSLSDVVNAVVGKSDEIEMLLIASCAGAGAGACVVVVVIVPSASPVTDTAASLAISPSPPAFSALIAASLGWVGAAAASCSPPTAGVGAPRVDSVGGTTSISIAVTSVLTGS
jgi:hypothetical protein